VWVEEEMIWFTLEFGEQREMAEESFVRILEEIADIRENPELFEEIIEYLVELYRSLIDLKERDVSGKYGD
jgi:hypothetical protein